MCVCVCVRVRVCVCVCTCSLILGQYLKALCTLLRIEEPVKTIKQKYKQNFPQRRSGVLILPLGLHQYMLEWLEFVMGCRLTVSALNIS